MNAVGILLVIVVQLGMFLSPLLLARAGFVGGEAAALAAIVSWFVIGMPVSYAVADRVRRRKAALPSRPRAIPAPGSVLHFR